MKHRNKINLGTIWIIVLSIVIGTFTMYVLDVVINGDDKDNSLIVTKNSTLTLYNDAGSIKETYSVEKQEIRYCSDTKIIFINPETEEETVYYGLYILDKPSVELYETPEKKITLLSKTGEVIKVYELDSRYLLYGTDLEYENGNTRFTDVEGHNIEWNGSSVLSDIEES